MEIGRSFKLQRRDWKIAGVFDAGGSGFESEIWGDVHERRREAPLTLFLVLFFAAILRKISHCRPALETGH